MSWDEFWQRRRGRYPFFSGWIFDEMDAMMRDMEKMMEESFKEYEGRIPKNLKRKKKLPDGSTVKEFGPVVYGYSITLGSDGKPVIREFGNIKPSIQPRIDGGKPILDIKEEREPLIDVMSDNGNIKIIAELPGVEKKDIKLYATPENLTISVDVPKRKYHKELNLPEIVEPKSAKSTYKNGVLEVVLTKIKTKKPKGEEIEVD